MPLKNIKTEFVAAAEAHVDSGGVLSSHPVSRGTLKGSEKAWIKKLMDEPDVARIEIMSQEFFRLLIPHQSETRLLHDPPYGNHYILSEEVTGYRSLPQNQAHNFQNGTYTGLGQVVVGSMYLQEIDLKNGNVGLDNQNRVAKIDGDWCFAEGRFDGDYNITPETIASLPYPKDFYAFNWFDLILQGTARANSRIIDHDLTNSPQFRAEVNQAMLKICLIPDEYIERYVSAFMPDSGEARPFIEKMRSRRNELQQSALQNPSFQAYLKTEQAKTDTRELVDQMNSFVVNGETSIVALEDRIQMEALVLGRLTAITFNDIQAEKSETTLLDDIKAETLENIALDDIPFEEVETVTNNLQTNDGDLIDANVQQLSDTNNKLLAQISACRVNEKDTLLIDYVEKMRKEVKTNMTESKQNEFNQQLQTILNSLNSPQVIAVKQSIQSLLNNTKWWSDGKEIKAQRIEDALLTIPLEKRKHVITDDESSNKVQEALASHWRKSGKVYKTPINEIDETKAHKMFINLKKQFATLRQEENKNTENVEKIPTIKSQPGG